MNIEHVSYFYPLFVVAVVFYFIGRAEGIREERKKHGVNSWLDECEIKEEKR